ncbi:hypothetical protein V6N13_109590 [Hibiscus sabdariffa]|uniref:Uncharacterized protein n=2 Tax=Hibiscus sabdariffa TaxID=183260 RepID=A0ABR1Z9G7_9ROSI
MPPRRETRANVGQAGVGVNVGEEHVPPPPPPPQVPAYGRGAGGVPQAPEVNRVKEIEESLGERKEDAGKRVADSSAFGRLGKRAQDRQF